MPSLHQMEAQTHAPAIPSIQTTRIATGGATTALAPLLKRTPLAAPTRTEPIPRRQTTIPVTPQQTARRMHIASLRVIVFQTGLTTRQELITPVRIQLIGPLHSIRAPQGRSRARPGLCLSNSTVLPSSSTTHLHRTASPRVVAILTENRNSSRLWATSAMGHSILEWPIFLADTRLAARTASTFLALRSH